MTSCRICLVTVLLLAGDMQPTTGGTPCLQTDRFLQAEGCIPGQGTEVMLEVNTGSRLECLMLCSRIPSCAAATLVTSSLSGIVCQLMAAINMECGQSQPLNTSVYTNWPPPEATPPPSTDDPHHAESTQTPASDHASPSMSPTSSESSTICSSEALSSASTEETTDASSDGGQVSVPTTSSAPLCNNGGTPAGASCICVQGFVGQQCERRWRDCTEGQNLNTTVHLNGLYTIQPTDAPSAFQVWCFRRWTRIQFRATDSSCGQDDFYRSWEDYKTGFSQLPCNFWIGNENLHYLTKQGNFFLVVRSRLEGQHSRQAIRYSKFWIESEANDYRIQLAGPFRASSLLGDAFDVTGSTAKSIQGQRFGTYDHDVNGCGNSTRSGWWFNTECSEVNLNVPTGSANATQGGSQRLVWPSKFGNETFNLIQTGMRVFARSYH